MNYQAIAESMSPRVGPTQEWVYQVLRAGIVSGGLPGGTQLKQDEISGALNVSHIPVREALRRLEAQGLVRIHPNRGASVTQLSRDAIMDMMEVRATLSVMMLRNGCCRLAEADFAEMERIISEQRNAKDLIASEELNYRFHDILSSQADNSFAELLMELVHANIDRYVRAGFTPPRKRARFPSVSTSRSSRRAVRGTWTGRASFFASTSSTQSATSPKRSSKHF